MEKFPIILLIAFVLGFGISFWIWWDIEKQATKNDENSDDNIECFKDNSLEDYDIDTEYYDDVEFIKYWYS